jgi:hypothetical protein
MNLIALNPSERSMFPPYIQIYKQAEYQAFGKCNASEKNYLN